MDHVKEPALDTLHTSTDTCARSCDQYKWLDWVHKRFPPNTHTPFSQRFPQNKETMEAGNGWTLSSAHDGNTHWGSNFCSGGPPTWTHTHSNIIHLLVLYYHSLSAGLWFLWLITELQRGSTHTHAHTPKDWRWVEIETTEHNRIWSKHREDADHVTHQTHFTPERQRKTNRVKRQTFISLLIWFFSSTFQRKIWILFVGKTFLRKK